MLYAAKIDDRHLSEQQLLEMAAFLYAVRFDAYDLFLLVARDGLLHGAVNERIGGLSPRLGVLCDIPLFTFGDAQLNVLQFFVIFFTGAQLRLGLLHWNTAFYPLCFILQNKELYVNTHISQIITRIFGYIAH